MLDRLVSWGFPWLRRAEPKRKARPRRKTPPNRLVCEFLEGRALLTAFFNNLASSDPGWYVGVTQTQWIAGGFTTDNATYDDVSASVRISQQVAGTLHAELYSDNAGKPGTVLGTFNTPSSYSGSMRNETLTISNASLTANTHYWIVLHASNGGRYRWSETPDNSPVLTASTNSGGTWNDYGGDTVRFSVTGIGPPVHTVATTQSVTAGHTLTFNTAGSNVISVTDADVGSGDVETTLTAVGGLLSLSTTTGLTFTSGDGTSDATMTFRGTVAAINTALDGLAYAANSSFHGSGSVRIVTSDLGNTGFSAKTDDDTIAVTVAVGTHAAVIGRAQNTAWWSLTGNSGGNGFDSNLIASWTDVGYSHVLVGDVNGDGQDDLIGRNSDTGSWHLSLNQGSGTFASPTTLDAWGTMVTWVDVQMGDVNGDGRADIVGRAAETGEWWVAQSFGTGFVSSHWLTWSTTVDWVDVKLADINGDGKDDVIGRVDAGGQWWMGLSNGTSFNSSLWGAWAADVEWVDVQIGDIDGDGNDDLAGRDSFTGRWWYSLSNGATANGFAAWSMWSTAVNWTHVELVDMDGDSKADLIGSAEGTDWWVALSGTTFSQLWGTFSPGEVSSVVSSVVSGDFNADGRRDFAGLQAGNWSVLLNSGVNFAAAASWSAWSTDVQWSDVRLATI